MTVLIPRLDRDQTNRLIEQAKDLTIEEISFRLPERDVITTSSELGGLEISEEELVQTRFELVDLARTHGFPGSPTNLGSFEGTAAQILHRRLAISPHEASNEEVWSYFTVCWLMDLAVWRWSGIGDERRFRGDVNRNTFRRLWWRTEVFGGEFNLTRLGEDELVNIMERPTIASNRRLVRTLAELFLQRLDAHGQGDRMSVMRDACKHLVRITPIVDFFALPQDQLERLLDAVLAAAVSASSLSLPLADESVPAPLPSEGVERMSDLAVADIAAAEVGLGGELPSDVAEIAQLAIGLAQRVGRVTNESLREVVPLDSFGARRLLQGLVERGELKRRGSGRGTHYVIAGLSETSVGDVAFETQLIDETQSEPRGARASTPSEVHDRPDETIGASKPTTTSPLAREPQPLSSGSRRPPQPQAPLETLRRLLRRRS